MIPLKTWRDCFFPHLSNSCGLRTIKMLMKHTGTVHEGPGSLMLFCVLFFRTSKRGACDDKDFYQTRRDQLRVLCVCSPGPFLCFCVFMLFTLIFKPFLSSPLPQPMKVPCELWLLGIIVLATTKRKRPTFVNGLLPVGRVSLNRRLSRSEDVGFFGTQ